MTRSHPAIEAYLSDLAALLGGPARRRARIVAEIRDHLLCEFEARLAGGQPAPAAAAAVVATVGDARTVATGFAELRACWSVEGAARLAVGCVVTLAALIMLPARFGNAGAHTVTTAGASGAAVWLAVQVAGVCAVIAGLRGRELRTPERPSVGALTLSVRATAVAVGCTALTLGLDAWAVLRPPAEGSTAVAAGLAVAGAVAAVSGAFLVYATAQVNSLRRLGTTAGGRAGSAVEMMRSTTRRLTEGVDSWCAAHPGRIGPAAAAALAAADRLLVWALAHRALASATVAAAAGGALALASLHEHGLAGGLHQVLLASAAAGVLFAVESAAVLVAVYAFDRLLGLWPSRSEVAA